MPYMESVNCQTKILAGNQVGILDGPATVYRVVTSKKPLELVREGGSGDDP